MPVPCAQLKVFSPLDAFPPEERERLRSVIDAERTHSRSEAARIESGASARGLVTGAPPPTGELVQLRRVGDSVLVCPLRYDLRVGLAYARFAATVPEPVHTEVVGDQRERARLEQHGTGLPHVLDHPFHAPLPWFLAFDPGEQRFTDPPEGRGPRLVHLTTAGQAAGRLERVIEVVASVLIDDEDVLFSLHELSMWLDAFEPASLLELDHADAGRLLGATRLRRDRTCAQLWQAVEALDDGDDHGAAIAYAAARATWSRSRALARSS